MDKNQSSTTSHVDNTGCSTTTESFTTSNSNCTQFNAKEVPALLKQVTTQPSDIADPASSEVFQSRSGKNVQNFLLVWLNANLDKHSDYFQRALTQLRTIVNTLELFSDPDQCVGHLQTIEEEKVFSIISGAFGENIVPHIHDMPQLDTIFGFYNNIDENPDWPKKWPKVKGIYSSIQPICKSLEDIARECNHKAVPMR
ncbi:unnamed protein product, partial [Rotaria magnacalcarata]